MRKLSQLLLIGLILTVGCAKAQPIPSVVPNTPTVVDNGQVLPKNNFVVPKQTIKGLEKPVAIGDVVKLSLSKIDLVAPLVSYDEVWNVYEVTSSDGKFNINSKNIETFTNLTDDKVVILGSGTVQRTLFVQVAVTYLYIVKDSDKVTSVATATVILSGDLVIGDGTNPQPPPPPVVIPEGTYGLTKFVYDQMSQVGNGRVQAAKAVAGIYDSIVTRIRAGTLTQPSEILEEVGTQVNKTLKDITYDKVGWDKVSTAVQDKLYKLYVDGQLKTAAQYADAFKALSDGLSSVK